MADGSAASSTSVDGGYVALSQDPFSAHQRLLALAGTPRSVLDVGGSSGYLSLALARRGAHVVLLDADPRAVEEARARGLDSILVDLNGRLPELPEGSFDLVICADVLEHLAHPAELLSGLKRLISPDGRLLCSVPNGANWALRLSLLAGRWEPTDRGLLDRTHLHNFTRKTFLALLREAGYEVKQLDVTCPIPWRRGGRLSSAAYRLARLRPGLFAYQHLAVATPA